MELPFNVIVVIIIVMIMLLLVVFSFYTKIKESGSNTLNQVLNIPDYLKKMFGG